MTTELRPAFYALEGGGWRDYLTLLHAPYSLWHLSYVVVGATLAPEWRPGRLGLTLAAFFLAVGLGAHALDELNGRPLRTRIPPRALIGLAGVSIAGAVAIGIVGAVLYDAWLLMFVGFGAFIVVAYNLELAGGRFHSDLWFALLWGAFPALTATFAQDEALRWPGVLAAAACMLLSAAQRSLSTPVRVLRRRAARVTGEVELADGTRHPIDEAYLRHVPERALRTLSFAVPILAGSLVAFRLT